MKFITHHRYKELALCGERLNIPYGTELETDGETITTADGKAVCYWTSENAKGTSPGTTTGGALSAER